MRTARRIPRGLAPGRGFGYCAVMREKISACITVGNEEDNIHRCLGSVGWVDEIVVIDSFSTDRTVEICREYTPLVYQHRWLGYVGQKKLIRDLATGPWLLFLDADEEISATLRDEILETLESHSAREYAGYEFPRMVYYLGRWIRHGDWYPDAKLRLFWKDLGECGGREPHDRMIVNGRVKRLKNPMFHYTYTGIDDQIATINRFSSISAAAKFEEGQRAYLWDLVLRPVLRFLRGYILKGGLLDGMPGLIIATMTGYSVFAKYAKLWEHRRTAKEKA